MAKPSPEAARESSSSVAGGSAVFTARLPSCSPRQSRRRKGPWSKRPYPSPRRVLVRRLDPLRSQQAFRDRNLERPTGIIPQRLFAIFHRGVRTGNASLGGAPILHAPHCSPEQILGQALRRSPLLGTFLLIIAMAENHSAITVCKERLCWGVCCCLASCEHCVADRSLVLAALPRVLGGYSCRPSLSRLRCGSGTRSPRG